MSRVNKVAPKPCCKICKDAGKSVEEYSSHWPKDNKGQVVCITLLNQECRYCHDKGHTPKHCPKLAKDMNEKAKTDAFWARQDRIKAHKESQTKKPAALATTSVGRFAMLVDDDDSDDSPRSPRRASKKAPAVKEEFPALSSKIVASSQSVSMSWSEMASAGSSAASSRVAVEKSGLCEFKTKTKDLSDREKAAAIHRQECFKGLNGKGWADLDESDDEDW
jgi:Nanos RNA binding domain